MKFAKLGESFCYWLIMGEIAFAEKGWLELQGYKVAKEEENDTGLTESHKGYTDPVAERDGEVLRVEIKHRSPKEQVERNIRKNLEYSDTLYIIASDEASKSFKKVRNLSKR